jgi:thioredoxin reductase (NADPH)
VTTSDPYPDAETDDSYDVVVIGGGVAGLSAAMFAARAGWRTVVVTELLVGGQILNVERIENYPGFPDSTSGADLAALTEKQAADAGAGFVFGAAVSLAVSPGGFTVGTDSGGLTGRAVIIATGSSLRRLGVSGEERLEGHGVSYCGSCDGAFFDGQPVAVVGGGDSAADEALVVAQYASRVTVVTREPALRAAAATRRRIEAHPRIEILTGAEVVEIVGDATVTALRARRDTSPDPVGSAVAGVFDLPVTGVIDLPVAGVFVYAGLEPNTSLLAPLVELDPDGRVPTGADLATTVPGLFAAGDLRRGFGGYLVNAASDGALAATSAGRHLGAGKP